MMATSMKQDVGAVCDLALARMREGVRSIIGIAGPPASGKSTLAESVVQRFNREKHGAVPTAVLLPMDGYHLDNRLLESRGLLARKGAPETFNSIGFCEAVKRLSVAERETFHPKFDRHMDLAIANSIAIHPATPVVIVEGNYLLLRTEPWSSLKEMFTATVFVCPSMEAIRDRLQQRWVKHGLDPEAASLRVRSNDLPNAEFVVRESREADLQLTQNYKEFGVRYAY
jgi:pantothenate kinase